MTARTPRLVLLLLAAAAPAAAAPSPVPCPPRRAQLFLSPMGEPFRGAPDTPAPATLWFAAADADHDGRLTLSEMAADADRFFTGLDLNGDGEIAPAEVSDYENRVAPEIRLYQPGGFSGTGPLGRGKENGRERREAQRRNPKGGDVYDGELGAGRFAWLNIPEPVAAADLDMNRGVSRAEFRTAAATRFRLLDGGDGRALTLATLPPLPAHEAPCPAPERRRERR